MANYIIKPAPYSFTCPIYGVTVKTGENCVEEDGALFCMKILEEKPLSPLTRGIPPKRGNNPGLKRNSIGFENLRLRLELETIAENPDGKAAKKIIAKYRRKMQAREEQRLSKEN